MSARSELDDLLYNEGASPLVVVRPRLLTLIDKLIDEQQDHYGDSYNEGYDEGYSEGYASALDEAKWRRDREQKDNE